MKSWLFLILGVSVAVVLGSCAHDDEDVTKHYTSDTFEVSAQGGDDKMLRHSGPPAEQVVISGVLSLKGVSQKYANGLTVHLIDRDATIFARARANSNGNFQLRGQIPYGFYLIRVIDKRFKGQLPVHYTGIEVGNLTVPVQPIIR